MKFHTGKIEIGLMSQPVWLWSYHVFMVLWSYHFCPDPEGFCRSTKLMPENKFGLRLWLEHNFKVFDLQKANSTKSKLEFSSLEIDQQRYFRELIILMIVKFFFGAIFCVSKMTLEVHESVQYELRNFYSSLNEEEKAQLKKFAKASATNFSFTNVQFLDSLKNEAAELFNKITGLREVINKKLDTMQPESRLFIENLLRRFLAAFSQDGIMNILEALKGYGKEVIDMFNGLSKPIQDDILKAFPTIGLYVTNDITRLMLRKLAGLDLIFKASTKTPTVGQILDDSGKDFPSSQLVEPKDPANFDAEDNIRLEKKKLVTTTIYPSNNDELLFIKKVVGTRHSEENGNLRSRLEKIHDFGIHCLFSLLNQLSPEITKLFLQFDGMSRCHCIVSLILLSFMKLSTCRPAGKLASNRTDITSLAIELLEFIPSSLLTFFGDLNDTDRSALLELTRNISRSRLTADTEKEFLEGLKRKSENAYQKVMGVQNYLSHKIERLKPESKSFTKKVSDKYISLFTNPQTAPKGTFMKMKSFVNETFKIYDHLSEAAKNDLEAAFPEIAQLIRSTLLLFHYRKEDLDGGVINPRFRDYMKRVFDSADVKRAFNRADRMINPKQ
ncbi:unnamed protein product [Wuchereria bancrofti]|uniref:Fatty-acid and retinol-binding protein 1 n=1 Tax=Wuchereria bancrofti TaxID=6293 RepID=A0A3P7GD14_WUCBA|nr:unnamed protein product [Wuchereria bancrofti]